MQTSITKEYQMLLNEKEKIEAELRALPVGYISRKAIKGKIQHYLQRREGSKIVSRYIRHEDVADVSEKIERRKLFVDRQIEIAERMIRLEQAASLIDQKLYCSLMLHKLSSGMDDLTADEKEMCSSFGYAMNAIEGVFVSNETADEIDAWKKGEKSFLTVFENTLKRHGFILEAR